VLPEQIERGEKKAVKESLQYEVIMTMKEVMGVRGGCAMQDKTVHDERVNGMDQSASNLQDGDVIRERIMDRTCFERMEQSLGLRLK